MKIEYRLLMAIVLILANYVHVEEGEDWLSPPDGFKWPQPAQDIDLSDDKEIAISTLTKKQRESILENWPDEAPPQILHIREADLILLC